MVLLRHAPKLVIQPQKYSQYRSIFNFMSKSSLLSYLPSFPSLSSISLTSQKPQNADKGENHESTETPFSSSTSTLINDTDVPPLESSDRDKPPSPTKRLSISSSISSSSSSSSPPISDQPPPQYISEQSKTNVVLPWYEYIPVSSPPAVSNLAHSETSGTWNAIKSWSRVISGYMYKTATGTEPQANVQWLPDELQQIAVIGVHGWFPMKTIQRVFGEPTGTSPKFCEQMEKAIQEFVKSHYQYSIPPECLTCMPLEGEGRIEHRVDRLFQQLIDPTCSAPPVDSNIIYPSEKSYWQHKLETAKTVFIATHSQGTPVSILLLSKLLTLGLVDPRKQKICVLAQAGISHGPFPYLKTNFIVKYFEADAARELFEFNDCNSSIAQLYHSAIQKILQAGVKVVLLSSWLDQVVPLYSSAFCGISHPNIYRAVFIDNENFYPQDFLPHLVIFALKLRNYGLSDYDLLVHLSDVVAGSIYTGTQGHSTLYDEVAVYTLAINFLLGSPHDPSSDLMLSSTSQFSSSTKLNLPWSLFLRHSTSNSKHPHHHVHSVKVNEFNAPVRLNPYHLPWIMHHIISDNEIKNHPVLSKDLEYLLEMFSKWDVGNSKVRKELKYRLDAIRNVLGNSKL